MPKLEVQKSAGKVHATFPFADDRSSLNQALATPDGFIGKSEVARRINKTVRTVENWMEDGILPYYKIRRSVVFKWTT
jgi:hypothetical protein